MKDLKGTKTLENLLAAFAGESQATNKYRYYASKAKKEGYEQIAAIFQETSDNEKEHAKLWFKLAHGIFQKKEKVLWQCRNCGYQVVSEEAPKVCPVCKHPQSFFQVKPENY